MSSRLVTALTIWFGIALDHEVLVDGRRPEGNAVRECHGTEAVGRFVEEHPHRDAVAGRRLLGLDQAQIEEVVHDATQAFRLLDHSFGELLGDLGIITGSDRLGKEGECADRCLELVAHVRDEVPADALDPARLGHVADERGGADHSPVGVTQRHGIELEHLAWRAEERQLLPARFSGARGRQQRLDRVLRQRVAVPGVTVALGREVADDLVADLVDDEGAVGERVEGPDHAIEIEISGSEL